MAQGLRKHRHVIYEADIEKHYNNKSGHVVKIVTYRCYCPNCDYERKEVVYCDIPQPKSKTKALERAKRKHCNHG